MAKIQRRYQTPHDTSTTQLFCFNLREHCKNQRTGALLWNVFSYVFHIWEKKNWTKEYQQYGSCTRFCIRTTLVYMPTWMGKTSQDFIPRWRIIFTGCWKRENNIFPGISSHIGCPIPNIQSWTHVHMNNTKWTQYVIHTYTLTIIKEAVMYVEGS